MATIAPAPEALILPKVISEKEVARAVSGEGGFYAGNFDGKTLIGAKKGNRSAEPTKPRVAIPTGAGKAFRVKGSQ